MKFKPTRKQITWAITIFFLFLACLAVTMVLLNLGGILNRFHQLVSILMSVMYGIVIAYILTPVVNFTEAKALVPVFYGKKRHDAETAKKSRRWMFMRMTSIIVALAILVLLIYALLAVVIPQLIRSITSLLTNFPIYIENTNNLLNRFLESEDGSAQVVQGLYDQYTGQLQNYINENLLPNMNSIFSQISDIILRLINNIINFVIGLIISVYLLYSKETFCAQGKKIAYAFFREDTANRVVSEFRFIHYTFTGFLSGKIIDSIIMGILCFIGTSIIGTPYPLLVSVLVGITNIVPVFGPYIGACIGLFFILIINPIQALYFLIFILILQQFDGNILGPKILGSSIGIPSFWVLFSILLFGGYFGIPGMIIGVPLFAVFYSFCKRWVERVLRRKELPTETDFYIQTAYFENGEAKSMYDSESTKYRAQRPKRNILADWFSSLIKKRQDETADTAAEKKQDETADAADENRQREE